MTRYIIHPGTDTWIDVDDNAVYLDTELISTDITEATTAAVIADHGITVTALVAGAHLADTLTEPAAVSLYHAIARRFRWAGTVFTRADVESGWQDDTVTVTDMPDDVWDAVTESWEWRHGIPDSLTERGNDLVVDALRAAATPT